MKYVPKSLLYAQVDNINAVLQTKPGNRLILHRANGGFQLQQEVMYPPSSSVGHTSISSGYVNKREMNDYLNALVVGMALRANQVQPI
jgi:hypothetical protein